MSTSFSKDSVREIICRNILSAVFGWYDMVYEPSGMERHGDVLYLLTVYHLCFLSG